MRNLNLNPPIDVLKAFVLAVIGFREAFRSLGAWLFARSVRVFHWVPWS